MWPYSQKGILYKNSWGVCHKAFHSTANHALLDTTCLPSWDKGATYIKYLLKPKENILKFKITVRDAGYYI